jgi:hypothetical protein
MVWHQLTKEYTLGSLLLQKASKEAKKLIAEGEDPEGMVHFIFDDNDDGEWSFIGLSSPLSLEEYQKGGYIEDYVALWSLAEKT